MISNQVLQRQGVNQNSIVLKLKYITEQNNRLIDNVKQLRERIYLLNKVNQKLTSNEKGSMVCTLMNEISILYEKWQREQEIAKKAQCQVLLLKQIMAQSQHEARQIQRGYEEKILMLRRQVQTKESFIQHYQNFEKDVKKQQIQPAQFTQLNIIFFDQIDSLKKELKKMQEENRNLQNQNHVLKTQNQVYIQQLSYLQSLCQTQVSFFQLKQIYKNYKQHATVNTRSSSLSKDNIPHFQLSYNNSNYKLSQHLLTQKVSSNFPTNESLHYFSNDVSIKKIEILPPNKPYKTEVGLQNKLQILLSPNKLQMVGSPNKSQNMIHENKNTNAMQPNKLQSAVSSSVYQHKANEHKNSNAIHFNKLQSVLSSKKIFDLGPPKNLLLPPKNKFDVISPKNQLPSQKSFEVVSPKKFFNAVLPQKCHLPPKNQLEAVHFNKQYIHPQYSNPALIDLRPQLPQLCQQLNEFGAIVSSRGCLSEAQTKQRMIRLTGLLKEKNRAICQFQEKTNQLQHDISTLDHERKKLILVVAQYQSLFHNLHREIAHYRSMCHQLLDVAGRRVRSSSCAADRMQQIVGECKRRKAQFRRTARELWQHIRAKINFSKGSIAGRKRSRSNVVDYYRIEKYKVEDNRLQFSVLFGNSINIGDEIEHSNWFKNGGTVGKIQEEDISLFGSMQSMNNK